MWYPSYRPESIETMSSLMRGVALARKDLFGVKQLRQRGEIENGLLCSMLLKRKEGQLRSVPFQKHQ